MFIQLKSDIKNIESLEQFIQENSIDLYIFFQKIKRVELLNFKQDFRQLILFNRNILRNLNIDDTKVFNFLIFLIKRCDDLSLNMEFKLLVDFLENNLLEDIQIIHKYRTLDNIDEFYTFNQTLFNFINNFGGTKKEISNILINYYLYLISSFNSRDILIDYQKKIIASAENRNFNIIDNGLFAKVFNVDLSNYDDYKDIEREILTILDNYLFEDSLLIDKPPINLFDSKVQHKFTPTEEQLEIIKTSKEMQQGQVLIIDALAGCTKTSTLEMITNEHSNSKFLYLAFNTKIVEDAKKRFPKNTEVRTLHSLAFKYEAKNKKIATNRDINRIISEIFYKNLEQDFHEINDIRAVYDKFCGSENTIDKLDLLEERLVKEIEDSYKHKPKQDEHKKNFFIKKIQDAIPYIPKLYEYMFDSEYTTHSTYLKKFVENMHIYPLDYDFIVLDESQDVSRVLGKFIILSIVSSKFKVIVVGDNNQKIYGFLGNVNLAKAIKNIVNETIFIEKHLTKTFRFSKNTPIENLTNLILNLRNIAIIGAKPEKVSLKKDEELRTAYLSRSKVSVLIQSLDFLKNSINFNLFMDKGKDFDIDLIIDIYDLYIYTMQIKKALLNKNQIDTGDLAKCEVPYDNKKALESVIEVFRANKQNDIFPQFKNKQFKSITSIYELEYDAHHNQTSDILDSLKIAYFIKLNFEFFNQMEVKKDYSHIVDKSLSILIEEFSNKNSLNVISTIHKVKGLEFEKVRIISSLSINRKTVTSIQDDEITVVQSKEKIIGLCSLKDNPHCAENQEKSQIAPINNTLNINLGQAFDKDSNTKKLTLEETKKNNENQIYDKLFIDKNSDTQEEYNILYVGITRAEMIIEIENGTYIKTLEFLKFIEANSIEINKIINNTYSELLFENKEKEIGIIYQKFFISIDVLKKFILQFKNYF